MTNSTTNANRTAARTLSAKAAARAAIDFGADVLDAMCEVGLLPTSGATPTYIELVLAGGTADELRALPRADGFTRTATGLLAWVDDLDDEQLYLTITDPRGWVEAHVRFPRTPLGLKLITAATTAALAEVAA